MYATTQRLILRALIAAALLMLAGCGSSDAKDAVRQQLRDPGSVIFRNVVTDGKYVCGEYNAKNGYGAYAGFGVFSYDTAGKYAELGEAKCSATITMLLDRQIAALNAESKRR